MRDDPGAAAVLRHADGVRVAGEDLGLIGPLMESLDHDLLPQDTLAAAAFGVRLHRFDSAVERALRDLEARQEVRAR